MMQVLYSIFAVALCLLLGKGLAIFLPFLPASLYGMVIFTLFLHLKVINANKVKASVEWGLANMGVCFVPAGVGIINHLELVKSHGLTIVTIIFFTTFLLITLVGLSYQRMLSKRRL